MITLTLSCVWDSLGRFSATLIINIQYLRKKNHPFNLFLITVQLNRLFYLFYCLVMHVKQHTYVLLSLLLSIKLQIWNFIKDTVRWCLMCFLELFQQHTEQVYIYFVSFAFCIMGRFLICHIHVCVKTDSLLWDRTGTQSRSLWTQIIEQLSTYMKFTRHS